MAEEPEIGLPQDQGSGGDELRSVAQLKMLHSLAARLGRLQAVREIGEAIAAELHSLIDYHSCRVYLLGADGRTLFPIAWRGRLSAEYEDETIEQLISEVGEGITGRVAATGESFSTPNARYVDWAVQIPGTDEIDESMLAVPMRYGDRVTGVIVLSSLGVGRFDDEDQRLLEVLASHAAVAFENARLLELEREAARTSSSLLALSQSLTGVHHVEGVLERVVEEVPGLIDCALAAAYHRDPETGGFRLVRLLAAPGVRLRTEGTDPEVSIGTAAEFLVSLDEPFVLPKDVVARVPSQYLLVEEVRDVLVAPLRWEPDGVGAIVLVAPTQVASFGQRDLRLIGGIADIASLAAGSARRFHELERFHELVEGLDVVFWEADAATLQLSFLSKGATGLIGHDPERWLTTPRSWGEHVAEGDRGPAVDARRRMAADGADLSLEYRIERGDGEIRWIRDAARVVRGPMGDDQLRGLMIDITERKRAEEALQESERKYSEAFRREREAAEQLRALDEMKNTFLAAVSHDLRTPLTSILGSALTLERAELEMPTDDALDLVRRIASNARKLERLLADLLDLDRLQRGIVSPQLRPTDLAELVRRVVDETELLGGRRVEVDADPLLIEVDAPKVERIVENLLSNAARHTPLETRVWVRVRAEGDGALLTVEDDGPGVHEGVRQAIFEPFMQGSTTAIHAPGVGIGLTLVARFAELHGGRAWAEEREGGGASFRVFLPRAAET